MPDHGGLGRRKLFPKQGGPGRNLNSSILTPQPTTVRPYSHEARALTLQLLPSCSSLPGDDVKIQIMQRASVINVSHKYDLETPADSLRLASHDDACRRLVVWRAFGVKHRLRIGETVQRANEPELPTGEIRYLNIKQDIVFPTYALTEYQPTEWNIEVRYDEGGESVVYPFQEKDDALRFQSLVTGYKVVKCVRNTSFALVYRRHKQAILNAFKIRGDPELLAVGEIQLWHPQLQASGTRPYEHDAHTSTETGSSLRTTLDTRRSPQLSDSISLRTDSSTGQQLIVSDYIWPPVLVGFLKEQSGDYTMLKMEVPSLQSKVVGNELHLFLSDKEFTARKVTVGSGGLTGWNLCDLGTIGPRAPLEKLQCTSLCLRSHIDDMGSIAADILLLQIEYSNAMLHREQTRAALRGNRVPQFGGSQVKEMSTSGVPSFLSPSLTARSFRALPSMKSTESLGRMISRDLTATQPNRIPAVSELE